MKGVRRKAPMSENGPGKERAHPEPDDPHHRVGGTASGRGPGPPNGGRSSGVRGRGKGIGAREGKDGGKEEGESALPKTRSPAEPDRARNAVERS